MPFEPTSPAGQRLITAVAEALVATAQPSMFDPAEHFKPLVVRRHFRETSDLQRVIISPVKSGLMRRDARGRFIGLHPRLRRQIELLKRKRERAAIPTPAEIRRRQQATLALVPFE